MTTRVAPVGALFRLVPLRWGTLVQYGALFLFLGWVSVTAGEATARLWLLAPTAAFALGFLPGSLTRGFAGSSLVHTVPGLEPGLLRSALLLGLGVAGAVVIAAAVGGAAFIEEGPALAREAATRAQAGATLAVSEPALAATGRPALPSVLLALLPASSALGLLSLALYLSGAVFFLVERTPAVGRRASEGRHLPPVQRALAFSTWFLAILVLHGLWLLAPGLPGQVGPRSPGLLALASLVFLLPLAPIVGRALRVAWGANEEPGERARESRRREIIAQVADGAIGGHGTGSEGEAPVRTSRASAGASLPPSRMHRGWALVSWGAPPTPRMWAESPVRAALRAGHLERASASGNRLGWFVEWLSLPLLFIGIGWAFHLFTLVLMGAAMAAAHPGLFALGRLAYPLSRETRARAFWVGHLVQGVAGVILAALLMGVAALLFGGLADGLPGGSGPTHDAILLLGLVLAFLPVAMGVASLQASSGKTLRPPPSSPDALPTVGMLAPALALMFAVLLGAIALERAGWVGGDPRVTLVAVTALGGALHLAGWIHVRRWASRAPLGP